MTRYRLLAVDLDGTLVGPDQRVSPAHAAALGDAKRAGLAVCLCTGRGVGETRPVWTACALPGQADPLICVGGALVCESDTGRTLHMRPIDPGVAMEASAMLSGMGHSVIAVVDAWRQGFDYYLLEGGDSDVVWRDWFGKHDCTVRPVPSLGEVPNLPELLRLTVLVPPAAVPAADEALRTRFAGRLEPVSIFAPNYGIHVVECFGAGVTKWAGVTYVAQGLRIGAKDIVAVGDDVNDLPMITRAGLGVAMGNAVEPVRRAARHVVGRHDEDGLADFVRGLLDGHFD